MSAAAISSRLESITEADVAPVVRKAINVAIVGLTMWACYSALSLLLWSWLAAVIAFVLALIAKNVVNLVVSDELDAAAQTAAVGIVKACGWLRAKIAAKPAEA